MKLLNDDLTKIIEDGDDKRAGEIADAEDMKFFEKCNKMLDEQKFLEPTATIINRLKPIINIKAE